MSGNSRYIPDNPYNVAASLSERSQQGRGSLRNAAHASPNADAMATAREMMREHTENPYPVNPSQEFTATTIMSYRPGHPHRPPDRGGYEGPWVCARVPKVHRHLPDPGDFDPNVSAKQKYLYWVAVYLHHQVGVFIPKDADHEGPLPQPGDPVKVTFEDHNNPVYGTYVPSNLGVMPSYVSAQNTSAAELPTCGVTFPGDDEPNQAADTPAEEEEA